VATAETATADADDVPSPDATASDVVAEPPAGEAVPTSEPPKGALAPVTSVTAPAAAPTANGPKGKTRSPIGGWLLLIPTLGIYYLFWYFNINRELRDYDSSIKVKPGWAVVSLFIPVVGLISIYNTGSRIRQAQATAGGPAEASGLLGLIASLFFVLDIPYYSSQLNKVWQHA
jgi:hypothetical protein